MKRNMAEKLTASILAAVLTFGMMAPQTAMTAEAAAKSTLEKDVQKLVKKSKAKKEKTQKKKLKKLFQYVEKNYGYARAIGFKNSRGWEKTFTAEMTKQKGQLLSFCSPVCISGKRIRCGGKDLPWQDQRL